MRKGYSSAALRPLSIRAAYLAVVAVLLVAVGVSSSHTHAQGAFDAARTCAVCHGGEQPVVAAASHGVVEVHGLEFDDPVQESRGAPAQHRVSVFKSRAPPSV